MKNSSFGCRVCCVLYHFVLLPLGPNFSSVSPLRRPNLGLESSSFFWLPFLVARSFLGDIVFPASLRFHFCATCFEFPSGGSAVPRFQVCAMSRSRSAVFLPPIRILTSTRLVFAANLFQSFSMFPVYRCSV
jgi:hypothetical protein